MNLTNTQGRKPVSPRARLSLRAFLTAAFILAACSLSIRADDTHPAVLPNNGDTAAPAVTNTPSIPLPSPNPPPPVEQEKGRPIFGVYVGNSVDGVTRYEQWLGKPTDAILGYTGDANWADYEGSVGWAMGVWSKIDRRVLWSVSLIPKGATLAEAAKGTYNGHWKKIAEKLATWRPNEPVIYIRTGWEFNGGWFHYNAIHKEKDFIGAWRQFVSTFRLISPRFRFDWCPAGPDKMGMNAKDAYPGNDYVDIIGLDIYDQEQWCKIKDPKKRWDKIYVHGKQGLLWHQKFALEHHKPMSYPEWGAGGAGSGDNPYFVEQMHRWFIDNHVIYATYWNSNANYHGQLSKDQYPKAGEKYHELFGAYPAPSSAPPPPQANVAPPTSATNAPPPVQGQ